MATDTETGTDVVPEGDVHDVHVNQHHAHPSDGQYIVIALILAAITAAEVATYYVDFFNEHFAFLLIALLPMMIVKFGIVAAFFMHLRFDNPLLRRIFVGGLILAVFVYMIALTTFHVFTK
jgi:cytochrome c oxidase subunit 4